MSKINFQVRISEIKPSSKDLCFLPWDKLVVLLGSSWLSRNYLSPATLYLDGTMYLRSGQEKAGRSDAHHIQAWLRKTCQVILHSLSLLLYGYRHSGWLRQTHVEYFIILSVSVEIMFLDEMNVWFGRLSKAVDFLNVGTKRILRT